MYRRCGLGQQGPVGEVAWGACRLGAAGERMADGPARLELAWGSVGEDGGVHNGDGRGRRWRRAQLEEGLPLHHRLTV